jgi:hypothetical protein
MALAGCSGTKRTSAATLTATPAVRRAHGPGEDLRDIGCTFLGAYEPALFG